MEIPENSEIVTPPAEKNPNKQSNEEPKEPTPPKTEADAEKITEEAKELKKKSSDKDKQLASEAKSHSIRETPASGDSEVRQPRARKQVQRWSEVLSKAFTEEQEAREKALDAQLAKGSGTALGEIPLIESSIRKYKPVDLKLLHFACFGRAGTASEVRSNLRKFNGFPFDTKAAEYAKREAALAKKPVKDVQEALRQLHLEVSGTRSQIVTRLLEFLLKPDASVVKYKGKLPPSKRKSARGRKSKKTDSEESESKSGARSGGRSKKASKESGEEGSDELGGLSDAAEVGEEAASEKSENPSSDDYAPASKKQIKKAPSRKRKAPTQSTRKTKRRRTEVIESESEKEELGDSEDSGGVERDDDGGSGGDAKKTKSFEEKSKDGSDRSDDDDDDKPLAKVPSRSEEGPGGIASTGARSSPPAVPFPSDEELKEKTVELLRKANLNEVSMKVIRQSLAEQYPSLDLSSKKEFLNGVIKEATEDLRSDVAYSSINHTRKEELCWRATLTSPWFYISTIGLIVALVIGIYVYSQSKLKPIDIDRLEMVKCPACFGQSACPAFFRGDVRLTTFYGSRPIHADDLEKLNDLMDVDLGMLERKPAVLRRLQFPSTSLAVDVEVCRRQRIEDLQAPHPRCVPRLSIWRWMATEGPGTSDPIDVDLIRNTSVFTRCASSRLLQLIQSRYRERSSNPNLPAQKRWLRFDELTLLFNLAINPHAVIAATFPPNQGWPFPLQLGACGRMTLEKGTAKPLSLYVNAPIKTGFRILSSLLQLPARLVSNSGLEDPANSDFALYLGDYRWDVFGVDPYSYQVSVIQTRHVIAVDLRENPGAKIPFIIENNASYIQKSCQDYPFATAPPCLSEEHVSRLCASNPPSDHNYWAVCKAALLANHLWVRDMPRDLVFSLEQCLIDAKDGARRSHVEAALEVIALELAN